jgi:curved DNA-binding protein CbpA
MKPFEQQNHYEVLDLAPDATPFVIRKAYKAAVELYGDDSMATYSFFSVEERKKILSRLEKAFITLVNEQMRSEYDQMLIKAGELEEGSQYIDVSKEPIPFIKIKSWQKAKDNQSSTSKPILSKPSITPKVDEILAQDVLTGNDLMRIRTEMGVSLGGIAQKTKVRIALLRSIEEDQFDQLPSRLHLKYFLKSYTQCLHLDPQIVVTKYMKRIKP